jgi:hypothetical protein
MRMMKLNAGVDLINKAEEINRTERKTAPLNRNIQKLRTFKK